MRCLKCNVPVRANHQIGIDTDKKDITAVQRNAKVEAGIYSVCYMCGAIGQFDENLNLRELSAEEFTALIFSDPPGALMLLQCSKVFIENKHKLS